MVMIAAARIKAGAAMRAGIVGVHIFFDAQFPGADAAKDGFLIKFRLGPYLVLVIGLFFMAGKAWVIFVAALEFDRNDIQFRMPVYTACLVIDRFSKYVNLTQLYKFERF